MHQIVPLLLVMFGRFLKQKEWHQLHKNLLGNNPYKLLFKFRDFTRMLPLRCQQPICLHTGNPSDAIDFAQKQLRVDVADTEKGCITMWWSQFKESVCSHSLSYSPQPSQAFGTIALTSEWACPSLAERDFP